MTRLTDLTPLPDLTRAHAMHPPQPRLAAYADGAAPCAEACRAGEDVRGWLALARDGRAEEAFRVITEDNPFPGVSGRVCYHPCESSCNRVGLDAPVSIHAVERWVGDRAISLGLGFAAGPPTGKRVLVVGAGPSGLSCAYQLRRLGHDVEIRDAGVVAGGMLASGIPSFRLPRDVLAAEVARIESMGARIVLRCRVDDALEARRRGAFDAVFLAVGAHIGKRIDVPARDAMPVLDAIALLEDVARGERPVLGRRVAIYGGGNTAMDAARVTARLGSEPLVIYRRDRAHMPARESEADGASAERVAFHWLRAVTAIDPGELEVEVMELDGRGRPHGTGRLERLGADAVILALGQDVDSSLLGRALRVERAEDGAVRVDPDGMTAEPGVFAGGDMVASERTVAVAIGQGARAARGIHRFLGGAIAPRRRAPVVRLRDLVLWYAGDAPRRTEAEIEEGERVRSFSEVARSFGDADATYEARRCFSCGGCFECDGCLGACPSDAVVKLGKGARYRIDEARCTGCGVCVEQCPAHAMHMVDARRVEGR